MEEASVQIKQIKFLKNTKAALESSKEIKRFNWVDNDQKVWL